MSIKYLRIASDLHLEGFNGRNAETLMIDFLPADERDAESILVLAGDVSSHPEQLLAFLTECCKRFQKVYYVAGNHEFYHQDFEQYPKDMLAAIVNRQDSFGVLQNLEFSFSSVGYEELEDLKLRFVFGTLWGDGGPELADQAQVGFYLNDFRLITFPEHRDPSYRPMKRKLRVADMVYAHKKQKADIDSYLKQPFDGKTVVITHHLPSRRCVSPRYWPKDGSDGANGGFVGDCDSILAYDHAPNLWIHGHTHDTIDTTLWKTRIICNPAGYRGEWGTQHNAFMELVEENGKRFARTVPKFVSLSEL